MEKKPGRKNQYFKIQPVDWLDGELHFKLGFFYLYIRGSGENDTLPLIDEASIKRLEFHYPEKQLEIISLKHLYHQKIHNTVLTIGKFDGVHLGHQKLMNRVVTEARRLKGKSAVMTFEGGCKRTPAYHQRHLTLTSFQSKVKLIHEMGIDLFIVVPFSKRFLKLRPEEFVRNILINQLGIQKIIVGPDFHFGKGRSGNVETLLYYGEILGFEVEIIPFVYAGESRISSTAIRSHLWHNDFKTVNRMLGREWVIAG